MVGRGILTIVAGLMLTVTAQAATKDPKAKVAAIKALDWLGAEQHRQGYWEANGQQYRVAMTALAGNAMLCEGSTATRGRYSKKIALAVDYLLECAQPNGLIGFKNDYHYTYGHGFSMLFLSQVFGEEEDARRREKLKEVLTKAVQFCGEAQTPDGGWGYVSAKDGNNFDEGSTCVTQVQGLRACRNAGIPVPKEVVDRAVEYIRKCTATDGGVQYSIRGGGSRPPITAAAIACLFNAGEFEDEFAQKLLKYCEKNIKDNRNNQQFFGHWHYTHFYYSQVMYRLGDDQWGKYAPDIFREIMRQQSANGSWKESHVGPVYVTAINSTILLMDNGFLPIYQR
ncbi:MAG: terpene cyclase/mutase family protein [Planctomycetaceae bacterium]|nr:terpene cyclase/mutase family protein [Planctomycetaceae bacterium]